MKMRGFLSAVLVVVAAAGLTGSAAGSVIEFGAFASYVNSDDLDTGYGGGAKLELQPLQWLSLEGRASWIHFDDVDVDMVPLEAALRLNIPLAGEQIVPYVGVGVGYYFFEAGDVDLDDDVGFFPLVGLEFGSERVALFIEARWLFLEADVDSAVEEFEDLSEADVDGLGINAGLLFRF